MLHIFDNDTASHEFGPDSPEALAALERSDTQVATILDAVRTAGLSDRTDIVIVSDHGFVSLRTQLQPNFAFKQDGLIQVNERGVITTWDAYLQSAGGAGFVYLKRPDDAALAARVRRVLDAIVADPANGVDKLWTRAGLAAHRRGARGELRVDDEGRVLHGDIPHGSAAADHRQGRAWLRPGDARPARLARSWRDLMSPRPATSAWYA